MKAAVAAHERGDFARAESLYRELTESFPAFADAWHYYGLLAHQRGDSRIALERLQRAHDLAPENLTFLLNFGRVLRELGQPARALEHLEYAHRCYPDHAQALIQLIQSLLVMERGGETIAEIERHLGWAKGSSHLWMLLGECRDQAGDRTGALAAFSQAALLAPPDDPTPHLRKGESARKNEDTATARAAFEAALKADPDCATAYLGLANLISEEGDFAATEQMAREALRRDRRAYAAWGLIAVTRKTAPGEGFPEELETAARQAGDDPAAWTLHFARGRVWEKLGEYERSFAAYRKGNDLRSGMVIYQPDMQVEYTRDLIVSLDEEFLDRARRVRTASPGAVFICGMPRSGTTLIETILASHPDVSPGGEMRYIHDRIRKHLGGPDMAATGSWLRGLSDETLREVGAGWRQALIDKAAGQKRVTDKMPGNYALLGLIYTCLPDAHIVHVRRDCRDSCFSCYATAFAERHAFSYTLESTGHYYRLYEALIRHWEKVLPPGKIIEIEYERLVADPESEIRRLLEALGLRWNARCLEFHRNRRTVATASLYQVRQPVYTSSVGRWRHFSDHLGPLFTALEGPPPL